MINKIREAPTKQDLQLLLKEAIQQSRSNPSVFLQQITRENVDQLAEKMTADFELSLDFLFNLIPIEMCFVYMSNGPGEKNPPILQLVDGVCSFKNPEKWEKISTVLSHHSTLEHALVLHSLFAKYCIGECPQQHLPTALPKFTRISAFIVEKFLTLKNEPAKGEEDHIENDKIIIKNCEKWLSESMKIFFSNFKIPDSASVKELALIGVTDIIGALMESLRQDILNQQILENLLTQTLAPTCFRIFPYFEIHKMFTRDLSRNNFENPIKKVQIPEVYKLEDRQINLNTQAFAYLTVRYLHTCIIHSPQQLLKFLIPITSQILLRPYQVKVELVQQANTIMAKLAAIQIKTCFEWEYPLFLFLFNLNYYQNERYEIIWKMLKFDDERVIINGLKLLAELEVGNLASERDLYILKMVETLKLSHPNLKLVLRIIGEKFGEKNSKIQELLIRICSNLKDKIPNETSQLLRAWIQRTKDEPMRKQLQTLISQ